MSRREYLPGAPPRDTPAGAFVTAQLARVDERFRQMESDVAGAEGLWHFEAAAPVVVLGAFGRPAREVRTHACQDDGVAVLRRSSGGGAVVLGPGCVAYSLVVSLERRPALRTVEASYRALLAPLVAALAVPGLAVAGTGDLAIEGRKVGGSAQRRGRRTLLLQGTLLYVADVGGFERYLQPPPREPAYRAGRSHRAFVSSLPLPRARLEAALGAAWGVPVAGA